MLVKEIYTTDLVTSNKENSVLFAAKLMDDSNTGTVIVVKEEKNKHIPIGIITDRDVAIKYVAREKNPKTKIEDIMSKAISVNEDMDIEEALKKMRLRRIRRTPVIDKDGFLTGIISMDDILLNFYREMADIATIIQKEMPEETE
jgi:CBS domain-containing protein